MRSSCRILVVLALVAPSLGPPSARGDELESLRVENRRLRDRVQELEAENARLRHDATPLVAALESQAESRVHREGDGSAAVLTTDPLALEITTGPRSRHWLWLQARGASPETVDLVVDAIVSGNAYRDAAELEIDVDGARDRLTIVRRTTTSRAPMRGAGAAGAAGETLTAALPRATLARLARAQSVAGKLGPTAFRLTPEHLAAIRAFDARLAGAR